MLRTILFFFGFWLSIFMAIPLGIVSLLFYLVGLKPAGRFLLWFCGRLWAQLVVLGTGSRLLVEGVEKIPRQGGICLVANHPGDFDFIVALAAIPRPFGFIAKKEVIFLPMIGIWVWLFGGVLIDRKNNRQALKVIRAGADRIRKGGAMIIYPEGTRSRGDLVLPFRAGALKLATMSEAVIIPMAIKGSWRVWEAAKRIRPATVSVRFGDPVPTTGLDAEGRRGLSEQVRNNILRLWEEIA